MGSMDTAKVVEGEVMEVVALEGQLAQLESALMDNPKFIEFINLRAAVNEKYSEMRKKIGDVMIPAYAAGQSGKTLKGDWGSVTVTETDDFDIDQDQLPASFWKKVPNVAKIRSKFQLEKKLPKGVNQSKKYGIRLDIKALKEEK